MAQPKRVPMNVAIAFIQKGYPQPRMIPGVGANPPPFPPYPVWRKPGMYLSPGSSR